MQHPHPPVHNENPMTDEAQETLPREWRNRTTTWVLEEVLDAVTAALVEKKYAASQVYLGLKLLVLITNEQIGGMFEYHEPTVAVLLGVSKNSVGRAYAAMMNIMASTRAYRHVARTREASVFFVTGLEDARRHVDPLTGKMVGRPYVRLSGWPWLYARMPGRLLLALFTCAKLGTRYGCDHRTRVTITTLAKNMGVSLRAAYQALSNLTSECGLVTTRSKQTRYEIRENGKGMLDILTSIAGRHALAEAWRDDVIAAMAEVPRPGPRGTPRGAMNTGDRARVMAMTRLPERLPHEEGGDPPPTTSGRGGKKHKHLGRSAGSATANLTQHDAKNTVAGEVLATAIDGAETLTEARPQIAYSMTPGSVEHDPNRFTSACTEEALDSVIVSDTCGDEPSRARERDQLLSFKSALSSGLPAASGRGEQPRPISGEQEKEASPSVTRPTSAEAVGAPALPLAAMPTLPTAAVPALPSDEDPAFKYLPAAYADAIKAALRTDPDARVIQVSFLPRPITARYALSLWSTPKAIHREADAARNLEAAHQEHVPAASAPPATPDAAPFRLVRPTVSAAAPSPLSTAPTHSTGVALPGSAARAADVSTSVEQALAWQQGRAAGNDLAPTADVVLGLFYLGYEAAKGRPFSLPRKTGAARAAIAAQVAAEGGWRGVLDVAMHVHDPWGRYRGRPTPEYVFGDGYTEALTAADAVIGKNTRRDEALKFQAQAEERSVRPMRFQGAPGISRQR